MFIHELFIAILGEDEGDIESGCILQALLHAVTDAVGVVLGFNEGERDVGLVIEDIVGTLCLSTADKLAADDNSALGE